MIDLYRLNLNLLVALDVLLAEKSVTQAAKKLFMTQAAMSNNLQQLREVFKDDLLVREKNGMVPTSYAASLQGKLHQVLEEVRTLVLAGQRFVPEVSQRVFKVMMSDYMSALILPPLLRMLEEKAPRVKIVVVPTERYPLSEKCYEGEYDLVLCKGDTHHPHIFKTLFFKDRGVCILNPKHPLADKETLSLDDYLAYEHVAICLNHPEVPSLIDEALIPLNKTRRIKMGVPFVGPIFEIIQQSPSLLGTVPERVAKLYQISYDLRIKALPFPMREIEFYLFWHQRYHNDLGHIWLREEMQRLINFADSSY